MTRALPRSVGGPTQRGCSPPHATDPVNIPHDVENRRVATRFDQELNPQISGPSRVPPQVTESARLNLSRWRHGFESRWDYAWSQDWLSRSSHRCEGPNGEGAHPFNSLRNGEEIEPLRRKRFKAGEVLDDRDLGRKQDRVYGPLSR